MNRQQSFTAAEAAIVTGLPVRAIQKAIDEGPLSRGRKRRARVLAEPDLYYLVAIRGFDPGLVRLTSRAKDQLRRAMFTCWQSKRGGRNMAFAGLSIDVRVVAAQVHANLSKLERARRMVVRDAEIRGGEPVIRGTRIPVYLIADMLLQGASEEEILSGYPTLKRENFDLALIYSKAYPRRGRPPRHSWHVAGRAA